MQSNNAFGITIRMFARGGRSRSGSSLYAKNIRLRSLHRTGIGHVNFEISSMCHPNTYSAKTNDNWLNRMNFPLQRTVLSRFDRLSATDDTKGGLFCAVQGLLARLDSHGALESDILAVLRADTQDNGRRWLLILRERAREPIIYYILLSSTVWFGQHLPPRYGASQPEWKWTVNFCAFWVCTGIYFYLHSGNWDEYIPTI